MAGWILKLAQSEPELVQVAIEVPHGPVVESLLNRGFQVHSINPRQLDRFRDRFSPAGAKDDIRDAPVLAAALRTDPRCLRRLEPLDALLVELREWSRIAEELTRLRTRLSHRLRDQLWRYYPQFLDLGSDLANNWMLALWAVVPTPDRARMVSKATIAKLLKTHRIRRLDAAGVLARLRTDPLPVAAGTTAAATAHIQVLSSSLNMLNEQLSEALCCISLCFDKILQIIPMQGRGILWINSLLQERVTVTSLTETYGSTGLYPASILSCSSEPIRTTTGRVHGIIW